MPTPQDNKPLILVVDDEAAIVEFIDFALSSSGFKTLCATSSKEALEKVAASAEKPSIAIVDIAIGAESGLELANALIERISKLSILFISGYVNDMVMIDTMPNDTRTGFLQKVFTLEQLQDALDELQS